MTKKLLLPFIFCLGLTLLVCGCGTTRSLVSSSSSISTTAPVYSKLIVGRNLANTEDQIRCQTSMTLAVEPSSVIKVYDDFGVLQPSYTTTADSVGCFTLDIGSSLRPQLQITATAPFKSESDLVGLVNPN